MTRALLGVFAVAALVACSSTNDAPDATPTPDTGPEPEACRPVDQPWQPGTPLLLPCERTEEPCDGIDNDGDGIADPHCSTRTCTSDADCTLGGLIKDTDCCVRGCGEGNCGSPDNCGGTCPCDGEPALPVCTQIDGWPPTSEPVKCQGVLCPPGLKCVVGECVTPGTKLPGQICDSGAECALSAGCVPFDPNEPPRCLAYCNELPCPTGYTCGYQEYPTLVGFPVIHETCRQPGMCESARQGCGRQMGDCFDDPTCRTVLECAHVRCEIDDDDNGDDDDDDANGDDRGPDEDHGFDRCFLECLSELPGSQEADALASCITSACVTR